MNKIYLALARTIIGKLFPGLKTIGLGWITTVMGILNVLATTDIFQRLCESAHLCIEGSAAHGTIMIVIGELMKIFRFATGLENGEKQFVR